MIIFAIIAIVLIVLLLVFNVKVVPNTYEFVIERLGKFHAVWRAGLHIKAPFIDTIVRRATVKEQVLETAPQSVITGENVSLQIDSVIYFSIVDTKLYTYGAVNPINALLNLTATTLRNVIGEMTLDQSLTSRDLINAKLTVALEESTRQWGIRVNRVEIKDIIPPEAIRIVMEKEMKAERDRRQTVLEAEGHKQAAITKAEGEKQAMVLEAEGKAQARVKEAEAAARATELEKQAEALGIKYIMSSNPSEAILELKKYDSLVKVADGQATKLIIPTDTVEAVKKNVIFSETTGLGDLAPSDENPGQ